MGSSRWNGGTNKRVDQEVKTDSSSSTPMGSMDSKKFKDNRVMQGEFPCYGSQDDLDIFTVLSVVCNHRGEFFPCFDCTSEFQSDMHANKRCRYPNAQIKTIKTSSGREITDGIVKDRHQGLKMGPRVDILHFVPRPRMPSIMATQKVQAKVTAPIKERLSDRTLADIESLRDELKDLPLFQSL